MLWNKAIIIIILEILIFFLLGRILIPYFRKLKTGKFQLYIGDRFKKDGSEPLFGGIIIAIVFIFGLFLAMGLTNGNQNRKEYFVLMGFGLMLMLIGAIEDYLKDIKKSFVGIKKGYKYIIEYCLSLAFLLLLYSLGVKNTDILLPFRLGYIHFGVVYYPLMALFMVIMINAVKVNNYFGEDTKNSVDGLCAIGGLIYFLFFSLYGNLLGDEMLCAVGYVLSAVCMGYLIWGISPSKIYLGESGALLLGGLISGLGILSGLHLVVIFAGFGFLVDGFCSVLNYLIYRKNKKPILKGSSLHSHFKALKYNDYKIIMIFSLIEIAGGIAGTLFVIYSMKLI